MTFNFLLYDFTMAWILCTNDSFSLLIIIIIMHFYNSSLPFPSDDECHILWIFSITTTYQWIPSLIIFKVRMEFLYFLLGIFRNDNIFQIFKIQKEICENLVLTIATIFWWICNNMDLIKWKLYVSSRYNLASLIFHFGLLRNFFAHIKKNIINFVPTCFLFFMRIRRICNMNL